jgi:hypothetical protein
VRREFVNDRICDTGKLPKRKSGASRNDSTESGFGEGTSGLVSPDSADLSSCYRKSRRFTGCDVHNHKKIVTPCPSTGGNRADSQRNNGSSTGIALRQTQLQWDGWDVSITRLAFTTSVKESYGGPKTADSDSVFVDLCMTVRNSSHEGQSFVPQNKVKIVIDDNSFDGEDLDAGFDYVRNIEPTLSRQRECYFELRRALVKDSFLLRFGGNFTDTSDVPVSITAALPPLHAPVFQASPVTPPLDDAAPTRIPSPPDPSFEQLRAYYEARSRPLSDEEALSEFNALQDRNDLAHAKRVHYDYRTDSYYWTGPSKGRRMSLPRAEFERKCWIKAFHRWSCDRSNNFQRVRRPGDLGHEIKRREDAGF